MLVMPGHAGIFSEFQRNLEQLGFRVHLITECPVFRDNSPKFRYQNFFQRIANLLHKIIGDRGYKKRLVIEFLKNHVSREIQKCGYVDYALVIRPDIFTHEQLKKIQSLSSRCYAYHWDGIARFPGVEERQQYFRKFYVFDPRDARPEMGIHHLGNFWFDHVAPSGGLAEPAVDVYFIGGRDARTSFILETASRLCRHGQSISMRIVGPVAGIQTSLKGILFTEVLLSYAENLVHVRSARVILDVTHLDMHQGFSLRVFEALGAEKKLITTNPRILECDFYHPNNIHLLTDDDDALAGFLAKPYVPIDPAIRLRYGFTSWISRVLELDPTV